MSLISCFDDVRPLWKGPGSPPASLAAPDGFKISPLEADLYSMGGGDLYLKFSHHLYADNENYYVYVPFLISNSAKAKRYGIKINGQTGMLWDKKTKQWGKHLYPEKAEEIQN